jgi:hypothetical protein
MIVGSQFDVGPCGLAKETHLFWKGAQPCISMTEDQTMLRDEEPLRRPLTQIEFTRDPMWVALASRGGTCVAFAAKDDDEDFDDDDFDDSFDDDFEEDFDDDLDEDDDFDDDEDDDDDDEDEEDEEDFEE